MTSNILLIIQARMESSRYKGKILAPLAGQPMLLWQLSRLARLPYPLVIATPDTPANAEFAAVCERHGYACHLIPGDPNDVLGRFAKVALMYPEAEHIVRLCGDCPIIDSAVVEGLIAHHLSNTWHDYTGLAKEWGDGVGDAEVFRADALLLAHEKATEVHEREHCSPYLWEHPAQFRLAHYPCPFDLSSMRCSVDAPKDLRYVEMILTHCLLRYGFSFGWREVWWTVQQSPMLQDYMRQRPMNGAYLAQVGSGKEWDGERYGQ